MLKTKTWKFSMHSQILSAIETAKSKLNDIVYLDNDLKTYINDLKNMAWYDYFYDFESEWIVHTSEFFKLVNIDYEIDKTNLIITITVKPDKLKNFKKLVKKYHYYEIDNYEINENEMINDIANAIIDAILSYETECLKDIKV